MLTLRLLEANLYRRERKVVSLAEPKEGDMVPLLMVNLEERSWPPLALVSGPYDPEGRSSCRGSHGAGIRLAGDTRITREQGRAPSTSER